ncbi:unnamed protein product [Alopecurus aequalis]
MASPVAAAPIADDETVLPMDVLYDILLRLPAKPLCRLRVVCPSWRSLLRDPTFIAAHAARHPAPGPLVVVAMEGTDKDVQLLDMSGNVVKRLKGAQQCRTDHMWTHHDLVFLKGEDGLHRVLDPATGATSVLPPRPSRAARVTEMYVVGWAAAAGEYKALTIGVTDQLQDQLEEQVCMVLTLGGNNNGGWRERGSPPARVELRYGGEVAVVNGVAYFLMMTNCNGGWHDWIVAFDLELEAWRPDSIRGPMDLEEDPIRHSYVKLVELNGHLVTSLLRKPSSDTYSVELWFLMDSHNNPLWSKQYTITLPTTRDCYKYIDNDKPLHVLGDGRILVWIRDGSGDYGVPRVYDPTTETFTDGAATRGLRAVGGVYTGSLLRTVGVSVCTGRPVLNPRFHDSRLALDGAAEDFT